MTDWRAAPYTTTEPAEALLARDEPPGGWPDDEPGPEDLEAR